MLALETDQRGAVSSDGYQEYLCGIIGKKEARKAFDFSQFHYFSRARKAASQMREYDYGIALAKSGIWLGYIFREIGSFPVLTVWTKKMGFGANWYPLDSLEIIRDKRVLVFENDVVTGRTLRRALRELQVLQPEFIDLLLVYGHTEISVANYEKWKHFFKDEVKILGNNFGSICLDTMCMVPKGFRRVLTLEDDL